MNHKATKHTKVALLLCALFPLLTFSALAGTGAWIYGTNVFADATGSGGVEIHFQPLSNRVVLPNGALMRTYPVTITTSNSGSIGSNYLVSGPYRVSTPETRDTFTINVPSDDAAYDWVSLATNAFSFITFAPGGFIAVNSGTGTSNVLTAPRLAKNLLVPTNSIGQIWTATSTNGSGAWSNAPSGGGDVTTPQLNGSSNALYAVLFQVLTNYDYVTSNGLYSIILTLPDLNTVTNVARFWATNSAVVTSNILWGFLAAQTNAIETLRTEYIAGTNTVTTNLVAQLNTASNILYGFISGGGITAGVATNIAQYFATNSSIITSNALLSLMYSADTVTSNGAVTFAMAVSNAVAALSAANDITTSNGAISFTMTASNNLAALLVANDNVTSNALRNLLISNDITTSNGALAFTMTASNNVITFVIAATNGLANAGRTELLAASNYLAGLVGGSALSVTTNFEYFLSSGVATGITAVVLDRKPVFTASTVGGVTRGAVMLAIGLGTTNCELRRVATISGTTINLNGGGFQFSHDAGERILWFAGNAHMSWWAPIADGTDKYDWWAAQNAIHEAGLLGIWLDGEQCTYGIHTGLVGPHDGRLRMATFTAVSPFAANGTNDSLFAVAQGERYFFTADPSTDTITIPAGWSPPAGRPTDPTNTCVVFQGTNLPAPVVSGKIYYVKGGTATTLTIGLDTNSAVLDLTTAGAGNNFISTEVRSMSRYYIDDITLTGNNLASNGWWTVVQQPSDINKLRVNSVVGFGVRTDESQDGIFRNLMLIDCLNPLDDRNSVNLQFLTYNFEHFAGQWFLGSQHNQYKKGHIETGNAYTGGSIINATSTVPVNVDIDGLYVTQSAGKDIIFEGGTASQAWCGVIKNFYSSSTFDSDQLMIKDVRRGRRVYGFKTGVPFSAAQYILEEIAPCPPSSESYSDEGGGWNVVGLDGALFHIGGQHYNADFAFVQAGTNHTGAQFVFRDSTGAPGLVVSNGTPVVSNALQYAAGSPASGKVLTISSDGRTVYPSNVPPVLGYDTLTVTNQLTVGNAGAWPLAANFNGTTTYFNRGSDMSGSMDTNRGTISIWFKSSATNAERAIFGAATANQHMLLELDSTDNLVFDLYTNSPSGVAVRLKSLSQYSDLQWHHAMLSWDLSKAGTNDIHMWVDGTNTMSIIIHATNNIIDLTADDYTVGTRGDSFVKWTGCLSDPLLWIGTNAVYTDFAQATNRAKFYASGSMVDPGPFGLTPFNQRPILYFRSWTGVNAGYGGNFTVNGTVDTCTPPPYPPVMQIIRQSTNTAIALAAKTTNETTFFAVKLNTDTGTGAELDLLDTNNVSTTRVWSQSGVLYSGASPANQVVPVWQWSALPLSILTNVSVAPLTNPFAFIASNNGNGTNSTNYGAEFKTAIGSTTSALLLRDTNGNPQFYTSTNKSGVLHAGTNGNGFLTISNNASVTNTSLASGQNAPSLYIDEAGRIGISGTATGGTFSASTIKVSSGATSTNAFPGGTYWYDLNAYTNMGSTAATFTNMGVITIYGNMLTNNGDTVIGRWEGNVAAVMATTNNFQIVHGISALGAGGTTILDTGLQTASNGVYSATFTATRRSATAVRVTAVFDWNTLSGRPYSYTNAGITLSIDTGTNNTFTLRSGSRKTFAITNDLTISDIRPAPH